MTDQIVDGGDGGQFGAKITIQGAMRTCVVDREKYGFPIVTVTDDGDGKLSLELELPAEITAARSPNQEELRDGISSFDPPSVSTTGGTLAVNKLAERAYEAAVVSVVPLSAPSCIMMRFRVSSIVNVALRALGYDV